MPVYLHLRILSEYVAEGSSSIEVHSGGLEIHATDMQVYPSVVASLGPGVKPEPDVMRERCI